jgi:hypothetical protein
MKITEESQTKPAATFFRVTVCQDAAMIFASINIVGTPIFQVMSYLNFNKIGAYRILAHTPFNFVDFPLN